LLSFNGIHYERIHDIQRLLVLCRECNIDLPAYVDRFSELNPFAVEGRYSVVADDMSEAEVFVDLLQRFKDFVENTIASRSDWDK
jgi:hypothetical protein